MNENAIWSAQGKPLKGIGGGRYWMDERYLYFEKGMLRTDSQQVPIADVLDVDVKQTMAQKARSVFTVLVHIERSGGAEVVSMDDIPEGREAQRIINDRAHSARLARTHIANTMRYEQLGGVGATPPGVPHAAPPATPAPSAGDDLMAKLGQLAEMKQAGILSDEEFAAAKAKLLG